MKPSSTPVVVLGPLAFPAGIVAVLAGVVVTFLIAAWLQRRGGRATERVLWLLLALALFAARAAFVLRWWPQYLAQPMSMLNLRDGGFSPWAGLLALAVAAALIAWRRPALRAPLAWSVGGGVLAWGFVSVVAQRLGAASNAPLPDLRLRDAGGQTVVLRDLRGKPMVINLWASWCGPCRRELPVLARAQRQLPGVRFVFADQGESASTVRAFLRAHKLQLEHVVIDDGMQLSQHYGARGYPTTLFLDAQGHLRDTHMGELSAATLAESLGHVTAVGSPASGDPH